MIKWNQNFITLVSLLLIIFCSCEPNSESKEVYRTVAETSSVDNPATFVVQKELNEEKTKTLVAGVWYSSNGGDKYKWVFDGNKLSKSMIYSFGEIGTPQMYDLKFLNHFDGTENEYGVFVHISNVNTPEKGIDYQVINQKNNTIMLKTKYGDEFILKK